MARSDLLDYVFSTLQSATSIVTILGPMTTANFVLFRQWPQMQPALGTGEPSQGWLCYDIDIETRSEPETICEYLGVCFYIFSTQARLADRVIDELDAQWQWRIPQQHDVTVNDYLLLSSRRVKTIATYQEPIHLYRRDIHYRWEVVRNTPEN